MMKRNILSVENLAFNTDEPPGKDTFCDDIITLNVRGTLFQVDRDSCIKHPQTLLSAIVKDGTKYFNRTTQEFFFNRDPFMFNCILNYYVTGHLHFRHSMCRHEVMKELEFWKIDETTLAPCCWVWYVQKENMEQRCEAVRQNPLTDDGDEENGLPKHTWKTKLYLILEKPKSSLIARVWATSILIMICVSIFGFILESLDECNHRRKYPLFSTNSTDIPGLLLSANYTEPHISLTIIEIFTNAVFTVELFLRWLVSKHKWRYCWNLLNIIDMLATVPTWLYLILFDGFSGGGKTLLGDNEGSLYAFIFLRSARLLRVLRLFRLVKTQHTIRIVLLSWKNSYKELLLLCGLLTIMSVVYGALIFFLEASIERFSSIPKGMWWSIITMTTVGYGDVFPKTPGGYIIGVLCAVTGLVVVATPIPVIVNNFTCLAEAVSINTILEEREKKIKTKEEEMLLQKPAMSIEI